MRKQPAPVFATGGGGVTFADMVAASFLLKMLKGTCPFDQQDGVIRELHFEVRDAGQALDDFLLVLDADGTRRRCAISVKSNCQLTEKGFTTDFAKTAWDQWRHAAQFDPSVDLLSLVVGIIEENALQEWRELQQQASSTTPQRLVLRLTNGGQSSAVQRAIFESLRVETGGNVPREEETAQLVARLRVRWFSEAVERACSAECAEVVRDGSREAGINLWSRLLQFASENRPVGGSVNLASLLSFLRGSVELKDFPDVEADWRTLEALSAQNRRGVRSVVGGGVRLARAEELASLSAAVDSVPVALVVGESGSGKSALVSHLAEGAGFIRMVWLTAPQCSKASQAELAQSIGLRYHLPELISRSTVNRSLLVVDGFEQFQGDAQNRALEVIQLLSGNKCVGWHIVFTCQPVFRRAAREFLVEAGIDLSQVRDYDLEKPSVADVTEAVQAVPGIGLLLLRQDLQPILRNLVTLDWVLKANVVGRLTTSPQTWIGETTVIDSIWERWTGTDTLRVARDRLLRSLAQSEGSRISGAMHIDTIEADQLPLLGELEADGLVIISGSSVRFSHDLMGDWARYRSLVFWSADAAARIVERATNPRWARAIRLYAQSLAEQGSGLAIWQILGAQFTGGNAESQLARDLFLDGLLFAANSASLLELVWLDLVKDQGQVLVRILKRLLHVASRPDPRMQLLVGERDAEQAEAWARIPEPHLWYPALFILSRHATEVASLALVPAAEVCALWLRTMPEGMPGRREAGLLALELAKETQAKIAEGLRFGEHDRPVHEALLYAAPEFPDEVVATALELCARRDEPEHAIERRDAWRRKEARRQTEWIKAHPEAAAKRRQLPPPVFLSEGPIRPPFPNGPRAQVAEGFRSAVLDTPALDSVTRVRPASAKEVLLAVCLDEPKPWNAHRDRPLSLDSLGLERWQRGYPPAYWKGPFWKFLQSSPEIGLETVVALVNHATERWLEAAGGEVTPETEARYGLEFIFDGKSVYWAGNANVYGWHRQTPLGGDAAGCSLMALERWLYDEVQQGQDIRWAIRYVFTHGKSLAFAGVLVSLGLKYPALFAGDLQPLLGNMDLYFCQQNWSVAEQQGDTTFGMSYGEPFDRLAKDWNAMPHRRAVLWDLATTVMLSDVGTLTYLTGRRAEWATRLERAGPDRERLEFFLARFDPGNYTQTELPDGRVCISMRWPDHLEAIAQESQKDRELRSLALALQFQARQCLSEQAMVTPEQLPRWVDQAKWLAAWVPDEGDASMEQYRLNSVAGALAVLVIQHREWLRSTPENEQWCLQTLQDLKLPVGSEFDSSRSITDHTAESFLGEAGVALLSESAEPWVLRLACEGITGFYYGSTFQGMWRAYLLREELGARFDELVRLVVGWSALRYVAESESGYRAERELLARYREMLLRRFTGGRLKGGLSLERAALLSGRLTKRLRRQKLSLGERRQRGAHERWVEERRRSDRKLYRKDFQVDTEVLRRGFGFLFAMIRDARPSDRKRTDDFIKLLFQFEMQSFPPPGDDGYGEIEGTPYQFDVWVMQRVAEYAAHCGLVEARSFYEPILSLGPAGRYWVEDFLQAWVTLALDSGVNRTQFVKTWEAMVAYAESLPSWSPGDGNYWSRAESLAIDLMGLHQEAAAVLGQARHRDVMTAMLPTFARWSERWLKFATVSAWLAAFLRTESGEVLLPMGIKKLAAVVGSFSNRDWGQQGLGGLLTDALVACWRERRDELRTDLELRQAFLALLAHLCARQIPEALHLRSKVAGSLDENTQG